MIFLGAATLEKPVVTMSKLPFATVSEWAGPNAEVPSGGVDAAAMAEAPSARIGKTGGSRFAPVKFLF